MSLTNLSQQNIQEGQDYAQWTDNHKTIYCMLHVNPGIKTSTTEES